jgi:hypothetical protein
MLESNAFDLEAALGAWRTQAAYQVTMSTALDELEDHLREEFSARVLEGNPAHEAWRFALAKLGEPAALGREFAKLQRLATPDRVALGVLVGAASLVGLATLIFIVMRAPTVVNQPIVTALHVSTITLGYMAGLLAAAVAAYATVRSAVARSGAPALHGAAMRVVRAASTAAVALVIVGFALGSVWSYHAWGRVFSASSQEFGAILVALCSAAAAASAWPATSGSRIAMPAALFAGGAILAAWFGFAARFNGSPLLRTVGFGGLALSLALAAVSLRTRRLNTSTC